MCGKGKFDSREAGGITPDRNCGEADATCHVLAEIIAKWRYPASLLTSPMPGARGLGGSRSEGPDNDGLDLIFETCGDGYFEMTVRDASHALDYYGRIMRGGELAITGETVNGHRVLIVTLTGGEQVRHEFHAGTGYLPVGRAASATIH
jgi:hypothetical protein